jgi:hypothetical protein
LRLQLKSQGAQMKTALVTLIFGRPYQRAWREVCGPTWRAYAEKHGYNVIAIDQPLDTSMRAAMRPPYWQKLLVLRPDIAGTYDRVVWVDADIIINPDAPAITNDVPVEKIGLTDETSFPSREEHRGFQLRLAAERDRLGHCALADLARSMAATSPSPQTGVMVLSPKHHREVLEAIYHGKEHDTVIAEQIYAGRAILERGLAHWLDPRFNALVYCLKDLAHRRDAIDTEPKLITAIQEWYAANYFLHFAAEQPLLGIAQQAIAGPIRRQPAVSNVSMGG